MLKLNGTIAVVLFAALTAVVALQVLNRFVLHLPVIWSEEVARFLFFWVVMLGAAIGVRRRRHFVIDLGIGQGGGGWSRYLLGTFPDLCTFGFSMFLLYQGIGYVAVGLYRTSTNADVNMGLVYAAIPVFAALSAVYSGINLVADYRVFRSGGRIAPAMPPAE
jgi:TRAP-type transport system small permease protein